MRYVVVGGGVAGVCCTEELCRLCPDDSVTLVAVDRMLKGVSVVARLSKTLEELQLVEKRLDELAYPQLTLVQDVAAGIDRQAKAVLLGGGGRLPFDKLCICSGARPKQLPPAVFRTSSSDGQEAAAQPGSTTMPDARAQQQLPQEQHDQRQQQQQLPQEQLEDMQQQQQHQQQQLEVMQQRVLTIRDTDSVQRLGQRLKQARRVVVVGNGGIALELIAGLQGLDVIWVMKHGHIGDAFFDLDAAQFLLEELQEQRRQQHQQQPHGPSKQQPEGQQQHTQQARVQHQAGEQQNPPPPQQQQQQQQADAAPTTVTPAADSKSSGSGSSSGGKVLGHAVGPRWMQQLLPAAAAAGPADGSSGSVALEYGCEIASIQLQPAGEQQQQQEKEQVEQQRQPAAPGAATAGPGSSSGNGSRPLPPRPPPPLLLTLTSGKQLAADLVLLAIGVQPALEWVPDSLERALDGGLKVNRRMQSSDPSIYAAGDSASCQWAAEESPHWFQMRLWSQARSMGVYAAHCMAGMQDELGADMAFELFTHVTRFLGKNVVLLGLYNGQRLEHEPSQDLISYSRVDEEASQGGHGGGCCRPSCAPPPPPTSLQGRDRSFIRVLLLRGRVQGAVLIGETGLEETFENLIMDQLDVGQYGPSLLDPDFELDHVFD